MVKKFIQVGVFKAVEPWGHLAEAVLVQTIYGFPARKLKVIGVTGTDGKTSTCSFIAQMLRENGYKVAMMTTVAVDYGAGEQANPTRMTTISALELAKAFKKIKAGGAEWLVLETTSHALAQHRVWGVPFDIVVMTNLSHEHLDYHGSFENYRAAKLSLFKMANRNRRGRTAGVINADDPATKLFEAAITAPLTYGVKDGFLRASAIKMTASGSKYTARLGEGDSFDITCHLPGSFNVYNSLAAVGVGRLMGLSKKQIEQGIGSLQSVAGRMTRVDEGQSFDVIVDYAHTPDSFEKLLTELKPVVKGKVITLFGSAGRRDEAKRAAQGRVAGKYSDIVVVTEEDDRDIDGQEILDQIASGAKNSGKTEGKDLFIIHKREDAIEKAIGLAKSGDLVLLLGKGHETNIISAGPEAAKYRHLSQDDDDPRRVIKRPYNEVEVAREVLRDRTVS